jgi:hypothetical protein
MYIFIEGKFVECRIVASNALYSNMITTTFPRKLVSLDSWFSADVKMRIGSLIQLQKNVEIVLEEKVIVVFIKHDKRGIIKPPYWSLPLVRLFPKPAFEGNLTKSTCCVYNSSKIILILIGHRSRPQKCNVFFSMRISCLGVNFIVTFVKLHKSLVLSLLNLITN